MTPHFITAIVTPLHEDDSLHKKSLELLIAQQRAGGIHNFLVGGTMGAMQLLPDQTYRDLMTNAAQLTGGGGELMAGAGDASFSRTRDRIEFLNTLPFDGVVVLAPYVMPYSQDELVEYFTALADISRAPLFLYDLPKLTGTKISLETVITLSRHPNIAGIKCSDEPGYARQLRDTVSDDFRVILAAATLTDVFLGAGFNEHLDGVYCLCPHLVSAIVRAAALGDWSLAAHYQGGLNRVLRLLIAGDIWRPATALLNEIGILGRFKPRPHHDWNEADTICFLQEPETQEVLRWLKSVSEFAAPVLNGASH